MEGKCLEQRIGKTKAEQKGGRQGERKRKREGKMGCRTKKITRRRIRMQRKRKMRKTKMRISKTQKQRKTYWSLQGCLFDQSVLCKPLVQFRASNGNDS